MEKLYTITGRQLQMLMQASNLAFQSFTLTSTVYGEIFGKDAQHQTFTSGLKLVEQSQLPQQYTNSAANPSIRVDIFEQDKIKTGGKNEMPRPLKYGQGSIKERNKQTNQGKYEWYEIRWYDEHGMRHTTTAKTFEQASTILRQHKKPLRSTRQIVKTFGIGFMEWYNAFKKPKLQEKHDKHFMKLFQEIPRSITNKMVTQITDTELQAYINQMANARNRSDLKQLISAYLRRLFVKGILKADIASLLVAPKPKAKKRNILPRAQEKEFLELIKPCYRVHALVGIYTGGRYSEIMRINESDKDKIRKRLTMTSTKGAKLKGLIENRHEIPLLPTIEHIEFPLKKISYSRYAENIRNACEKIGIKLTSHDFKHTFAYRCRIAGVDLQTFSGWLDHSHTKMSLMYSDHIDDEFFEKEAAKLRKVTPIVTPIRTENMQNHV